MYRYLIIGLLIIATSCNIQKKLQRTYIGEPEAILPAKFGYPKATLDRDGEKVLVYEIVKDLKSTEIQQGKLTLDPVVSPMVQKTERYYFTIKNGTITNIKLEEEYER
jgi:hypothetical protein